MTIKITPQLPRVINKGLNSTSIVLKITKIKKPTNTEFIGF